MVSAFFSGNAVRKSASKSPLRRVAICLTVFFCPAGVNATPCDDLARSAAVYLHDPLFDPRALEIIRRHPISELTRQASLENRHFLFSAFDTGFDIEHPRGGMGYVVQNRMIRKILQTVFPGSRFHDPANGAPEWPSRRDLLTYRLRDFALGSFTHWDWGSEAGNTLQMVHLKQGNPEIFVRSKESARAPYGIPDTAHVVSVYSSGEGLQEIPAILTGFPSLPDIIIVSISMDYPLDRLKEDLGVKRPYVVLSELAKDPSSFSRKKGRSHSQSKPLVILNDSRGRMPEMHAASDQVIVIGPNNFFEPLMVKRPTLIYAGKNLRYNRNALERMEEAALATGGAVVVNPKTPFSQGIRRLLAVNPEHIEHPAFAIPPGQVRNGFENLLDHLNRLIRDQW